jgi:arsenate reductase
MSEIRLYHNPGCSKSRGALALLNEKGVDVEVVEYLDSPPHRAELEKILALLPDPASALVRHDKYFESLGLDPDAYTSPGDVVSLLLEHPRLMQRPIALSEAKALIGRPSERVLELVE